MPNHLVLVRHGESEGNVVARAGKAGNEQLFTDEFFERPGHEWRLTDVGVEQAEAAGLWIGKFLLNVYPELNDGFGVYYTSPHVRTRETAGHLAIDGANWRKERRIRERDWGDIESMSRSQFEKDYPQNATKKYKDPLYWQPPGGESIAGVADTRVRSMHGTLHRQHDEKDKDSAIFATHGEYIWAEHLDLERMGHEEWKIAESDASRKIKNCQVVHFTRLNPESGYQAPSLAWVRSVCPWETPDHPGHWRNIEMSQFSNEQLLAEVDQIPRLDLSVDQASY